MFWYYVYLLFLYYVCESVAMAESPAQLNQQSDDPGIGKEMVVTPVVTQVVDVAPGISQANAAKPDIDEADTAPGISVNTGNLFFNAALYKDRDELIKWCKIYVWK
jgi:hypothetical protein